MFEDDFDDPIEIINGAMRSYSGTFYELPEKRIERPRRTERQKGLIRDIPFLAKRAGDASPEHALAALQGLKRAVDELERESVAIFRSHGVSWRTIAHYLGESASSVHRRFAR
jgi:hypothetical protein